MILNTGISLRTPSSLRMHTNLVTDQHKTDVACTVSTIHRQCESCEWTFIPLQPQGHTSVK